jgi:hypothetical protein
MRASAKLNNGPPSAQTRLGTASMAHLHSLGKGANKTPPDCVAFDLPQGRMRRTFRRRAGLPVAVCADGLAGKTDEGETGDHNLRSGASRRYFPYITTAGAPGARAR